MHKRNIDKIIVIIGCQICFSSIIFGQEPLEIMINAYEKEIELTSYAIGLDVQLDVNQTSYQLYVVWDVANSYYEIYDKRNEKLLFVINDDVIYMDCNTCIDSRYILVTIPADSLYNLDDELQERIRFYKRIYLTFQSYFIPLNNIYMEEHEIGFNLFRYSFIEFEETMDLFSGLEEAFIISQHPYSFSNTIVNWFNVNIIDQDSNLLAVGTNFEGNIIWHTIRVFNTDEFSANFPQALYEGEFYSINDIENSEIIITALKYNVLYDYEKKEINCESVIPWIPEYYTILQNIENTIISLMKYLYKKGLFGKNGEYLVIYGLIAIFIGFYYLYRKRYSKKQNR